MHSTPARAARLRAGLGHAEKLFLDRVWWPAFHDFTHLYPEYELHDYNDSLRYIDFAYLNPHFRLAIEIDGVGTHWQQISTAEFADHCRRQNHLIIDEWRVIRFAYSDVRNFERNCQQTLQQLIGRLTVMPYESLDALSVIDREIMRLAVALRRAIVTADVMAHVNLSRNTARSHLKRLVQAEWLAPHSGALRVRSYKVQPRRINIHP